MSHIFCCANISKHKYKLYARSSRTRSEIIGIIRPISTHRHSFVHQGRLAIFFQSQPDFSIHRRFCLKRYAITSGSWHINHLIKLRRPGIGKCSWDIGNKALFSSVNGICTPVFCPSSLHPHSIPEKCAKGDQLVRSFAKLPFVTISSGSGMSVISSKYTVCSTF